MKKIFITLFALMSILMPAVFAEHGDISSSSSVYYNEASKSLQIISVLQNNTEKALSGKAYFGIYDGDNLVRVDSGNFSLSEKEDSVAGVIPASSLEEKGNYTVKVFLWDEDMASYSKHEELTYSHVTVPEPSETELHSSQFESYNSQTNKLVFAESTESLKIKSYKLDSYFTFYVNGVETYASEDIITEFIEYNDTAVTLKDTDGDGDYDIVMVTYSIVAVVDCVYDSVYINEIYFKDASIPCAWIEILKNDDDYTYSIKKDGIEISPMALKENDVLTIQYDVTGDFNDSIFYNITVCDKTVTGLVKEVGTDENGDEYYCLDNGTKYYIESDELGISIRTGSEYIFHLTSNNRIAYAKQLSNNINYAIFERAYQTTNGEVAIRIIGKDGEKYDYELYDENSAPDEILALIGEGAQNEDIIIIDYTLTSNNKIKIKDNYDMIINDYTYDAKSYTAATQRLGSTKIDESTVILDISAWVADGSMGASRVSMDDFVDGCEYSFISARDRSSKASEPVPFIAITSGLGGFTINSQMSIVDSVSFVSDGEADRTKIKAYVNGELTELICEDTSYAYSNLQRGDAFIYKTNSDRYVDELYLISNVDIKYSNRFDYFEAIYNGRAIYSYLPWVVFDGERVEYILAPVVDSNGSCVTIGNVNYGDCVGDKYDVTYDKYAWYMNVVGDDTLPYTSDTKFYRYDGNTKKVSVTDASGIVKSFVTSPGYKTTSYLDTAGLYINLGMSGEKRSLNRIAFALIRVHDDIVKEIYSIVMPDDDVYAKFEEMPNPTPGPMMTPAPTMEVEPSATPAPYPY